MFGMKTKITLKCTAATLIVNRQFTYLVARCILAFSLVRRRGNVDDTLIVSFDFGRLLANEAFDRDDVLESSTCDE